MSRDARVARADGEATHARILEAAGELFATQGLAETSNKVVAAKAGVDLASINYHFGSRGGLYRAVLLEAHRRLPDLADLRQLARGPLPAADRLRLLIDYLVRRIGDGQRDWHLSVLAAEVIAPSSHVQVLLRQSDLSAKVALVLGILGEITAIPADDPVLMRCLLSVAAPCLMLQIGRRSVLDPIQEILRTPHEEIVEYLYRFSIAGLELVGREYALEAKAEGGSEG